MSKPAKPRICVFAPVPPPVIGSSVAVKSLLGSELSRAFDVVHVNTVYSTGVSDVGRPSVAKVLRFFQHSWRLRSVLAAPHAPECVITVPTFDVPTVFRDAVAAALVKRRPGTKLVLWMHSARARLALERASVGWARRIRRLLSAADHVVVLGSHLERQLDGLVEPALLSIIPNGVAIPPNAAARKTDGRPVRVLFLSQMLEAKGWRELLVAAEGLCVARADVRFDFYGEPGPGSTKDQILQTFGASCCPDRIRYHGPVYGAAKDLVFAESDLFCLPSAHQHEALPIALLEAMASGLAVVASDVGSVADAARPEGSLLVQPRRPEDLRAAIETLLDDRERLAAMGDYNRRRAQAEYSEGTVAAKWIDLLFALLRPHDRRQP